jgi:uncharacterized protein involved in exopolysaccharide biosynthesis
MIGKEPAMPEPQDQVELMDYLNVLWRRKWLIILPTLLLTVGAAATSLLLPHKWEVDGLIQPSKLFVRNESGILSEVVFVDPIQVASQINRETYNRPIAAEHNLDPRNFPKLKAESLAETNLIHVSLRDSDIGRAKTILSSLFSRLKAELDGKAEIELKGVDSQINWNRIEKARFEAEIKIAKNKVRLAETRIKQIEREMDSNRSRVGTLEKEQMATLKSGNKDEAQSLALLLYSNEIQQSLQYLNTLQDLLDDKKIEEENLNTEIEDKEKKILQIDNAIQVLTDKKGLIDYTRLVKEPTASVNPVFPSRRLIVAVAFVAGFLVFAFLALFLEYVRMHTTKP